MRKYHSWYSVFSFLLLVGVILLGESFYSVGTTASGGEFSSRLAWGRKKTKSKKAKDEKKTGGLAGYASVIKPGAETHRGFISVHRVEDKYYFEIPFAMCNRDLLVVNVVAGVTGKLNETGLNKGINYQNKLIRFDHDARTKRLLIREVDPVPTCLGGAIAASVQDNFINPIITSLKLKAYSKDSTSLVVDVTKLLDGSSDVLQNIFGVAGLGTSPKSELSSIREVKAFPTNVMVRSELGTRVSEGDAKANITVLVTTNIVLLPEEQMVPRFADERIGIFTEPKQYYSDDQQRVLNRKVITRWRIEPKPEDRERYLKGELVEPQKPIVFYIDRATPKQWVKYIKLGIEDWKEAFEQAGFRNAIQARELTDGDSIDLDDARYSSVVYAASELSNAMGPSVIDPRTGEILESDIMWWHNVMAAVHRWMRLQTGILDSEVRGNTIPVEKMGMAIRFVAGHEVGHTLGLMHNMGASFAFSVKDLRSPAFTSAHGTATSIMDYARFNYVAQPGDGVTQLTPQIGVYDRYAIEYAYRWRPVKTPFEDEADCQKMIAAHAGDPAYFFGPQASSRSIVDPRSQSEDVSNNAMEASRLGIRNLKKIMPQVLEWTNAKEGNYIQSGKFLHDIIDQWHLYAYHVLANVGGIYLNDRAYCMERPSFVDVPKATQKDAVKFLCEEVLTYPEWLFGADIYSKVYPTKKSPDGPYEYAPMELFKNYQGYILWDMLDEGRLARMVENEARNGGKAYTLKNLFDDMHACVFKKTLKGQKLSVWDRIGQKGYVDALIIASDRSAARKEKKRGICDYDRYEPHSLAKRMQPCAYGMQPDRQFTSAMRRIKFEQLKRTGDVLSMKRGELERVLTLVKKHRNAPDVATRNHYRDLALRIEDALRVQ